MSNVNLKNNFPANLWSWNPLSPQLIYCSSSVICHYTHKVFPSFRYVSCALGCPHEGHMEPAKVAEVRLGGTLINKILRWKIISTNSFISFTVLTKTLSSHVLVSYRTRSTYSYRQSLLPKHWQTTMKDQQNTGEDSQTNMSSNNIWLNSGEREYAQKPWKSLPEMQKQLKYFGHGKMFGSLTERSHVLREPNLIQMYIKHNK